MNTALGRLISLVLFIFVSIGVGVLRCPGQSNVQQMGSGDNLTLPRLCMAVTYRQAAYNEAIKTRIAMMGDRYHEVKEALLGSTETGVPLVGFVDGRWEAVPCGDDTGLFYLVPLLARETGWTADRSLDVFLIGIIVVSVIVGGAGLWLTAGGVRQRTISVVPLMVGAYLSYKMGDVYVVESAVVLMLVPWLLFALKVARPPGFTFSIVFLSGIALGFAQWIRTQSGSPMVVFFMVLACFSSRRRSTRLLLCGTLLIGMSLPLLYSRIPLHNRDSFLAAHQPGYQKSLNQHLFWHTVYVGLSYLTNPFVPAWRDVVAIEYVASVDSTAIYGGAKYEKILRSRVNEIVHEDPKFIFNTIAAKCGVLGCMLLLCINVGLPAAFYRAKPLGIELAFWSAMVFGALPGMLAIPLPQYVLGMITLALYYWCYSINFYLDGSGNGRTTP
jgi:hypothetical protein